MAAPEEGGPPPPYEERRREGGSFFVRAMYDFASPDSSSLSFEKGQLIEVLTQLDSGWWDGLMGEDIRGWFPSNYVEVISEEEAQEELRAQGYLIGSAEDELDDTDGDLDDEGRLRDVSSVYRRLGIDSELDGMQQLMAYQGDTGKDEVDAFEQLAEAAMHGRPDRQEGPESISALRAARRRSRMSEASGLDSVGAGTSLTDLSLQQSRSAATSMTEADHPHAVAAFAAYKQTLRAGPSDRERDRLRSQSIGVAGNQAGAQLRPRAATNVGARSGSPSESAASTPREYVGTSGSRRRQTGAKDEAENWLPKLTPRGEIVYVNIRTGAEVSEIPLEGADAFAGSSNQTSEDETYHSDYSGNNAEAGMASKGSSTAAVQKREAERLRNGSMSSSNTVNSANTATLAKRNPVGAMPNPADVLRPWKLRLSSDEHSFFFYNVETQESRYDAPPQALRTLRSDPRTGSLESLEELADEVGGRKTRADTERSRSGSQSGDLEWDATAASLPGKSPHLAYEAKQRTKTMVAPTSLLDAPHSMLNDEQEALELQHALDAPPPTSTKLLVDHADKLIGIPAPETAANRNPEREEAFVEKLTSYRQRVREEAVELGRVLGAFAMELYQAKNARNHSAATASWARRVQGVLVSGKGTAGIGLELLGGGSAAGWRGSGFVLPDATEAAALRAESMGSFQNPFELTRDAQNALASGKVAMRRRPTQLLNNRVLDERLQSHHDDLNRQLDELARIIQSGGAPQADRSPRSSQMPFGLKADTAAQRLSRPGIQMLLSQVKFILIRFGTIMTLVEELDVAGVIDVDGPAASEGDEADDERRRLMVSVVNARLALHALSSVKQGAYDCSSNLMMDAQDASIEPSSTSLDSDLMERMLLHARALSNLMQRQLGLLHDISDIAEEQASESMQSIGARSKVYGTENVHIAVKDGPQSSGEIAGDEVMYLGPGLSVPNGPVANRAEPRTPAAGSSKSSMAPSVRSGMGMRTRSTSVTTGVSVGSQDSSTKFLPRRGTDATADSDSLEAARSKSASKMKRFFGDDPLVPPPGVSQSEASASKATADSSHASSTAASHTPSLVSSKPTEEIPWFLEPDYAPQDLVFNATGQVKGATLGALMERLTMHNTFDPTFNNTFLMTYRSFTTTETFLDLLFARFRIRMPPGLSPEEQTVWTEKKQTPIRLRVFNVLKSWIESHFYEGEDDDHLKRIKEFALDEMAQSLPMETPSKLLIRLVERKQGDGEQMVRKMVMPTSAPQPIVPKNSRKVKFLEIDPLEMARQLTLIDSRLYNQIRPVECLGKAWSQSNGETIAKGIRDSISANNRVSGWVSESVLTQEDLKKRAAYVKHFVAIADRCFALNNFSSMMAIYSGLNNAALNRLRRTWDAVNQRHLAMFENMKVTLAPTKNFSRYRHTLRQLNPPCVPFLGVYLTDLTFIEDGNSDHLKTDERLINFSKRQMTAEKIGEIMIYQSTPYNLTPVQPIQKFIEDSMMDSRGDDELFEQSLRLEPREREDEKIARLLQESGFL
ncbi:Ras1 guanine nucleotide exchange factor [Ceraceosorus bombacis]|uniref:Ras1 guanine nucleotide exchange factor n=1 Tax=Ceraceosorus bombacis TaxID=401625 RepID=A0A0P1BIU3_9BASI|nr:Ras1 guanine nucleotide exchange factor [Ceraceosorus bombacis]